MFQDLVIRCEEAKRHRSKASIEKKYSPLSEEGEKYVGCTPHPVLCTTFSHTVEKEEIDTLPFTLHLSLKKRAAFTLAEVLITLGIIGVVAAMTMPSLINKYQMKSYEVAFKKQYSVFSNALNWQFMENSLSNCYYYYEPDGRYYVNIADCGQLFNNIVSYMQLTEIDDSVKSLYATSADVTTSGGKLLNTTFAYNNPVDGAKAYFSKDGAIYMFTQEFPVVIIDVNGEKGPNKWGYDAFYLILSSHNEKLDRPLLTDEFATMVEKGGMLPRNILMNKKTTEDSDFTWFWSGEGVSTDTDSD